MLKNLKKKYISLITIAISSLLIILVLTNQLHYQKETKTLLIIFTIFLNIILNIILFKLYKKRFFNKKNLLVINTIATLFIIIAPPNSFSYFRIFISFTTLFIITGMYLSYKTGLPKIFPNFTDSLLVSIAIGISFWLMTIYLTTYLGIEIHSWMIYIINLIFIGLMILFFIKNKISLKKFYKEKINNKTIIFFTIFNVVLALCIIPTKGLISPPLHDPAQNSISAYQLILSKFLYSGIPKYTSHYPPGGAYIVGLVSVISKVNTATTNLVVTNIFQVFVIFGFGLLMKTIFRKKYIEFIAIIILAFISMYTLMLYGKAGKNSQIIAYFFLYINLVLLYKSIYSHWLNKILVSLVLGTSFLIHYNNIPIFLTLALLIFIKKIISKKVHLKKLIKELISWIIPILLFLLVFLIQIKKINAVETGTNLTNTNNDVFSFNTFDNFLVYIKAPPICYYPIQSQIVFLCSVISYIFILIYTFVIIFKYRKIPSNELFILTLPSIYYILFSTKLSVVSHFLALYIFILILIPIIYLLRLIFTFKIKKHKKVLYTSFNILKIIILFVIVYNVFLNLILLAKMNLHVRKFSVVREADLEAFQWIEDNIEQNQYILPANIYGFELNQNFVYDSLLFLRAFTNNEEILGFVQGDKIYEYDYLRELYIKLSKNLEDKNTIQELLDNNIIYIYDGSIKPWGEGYINSTDFESFPNIYKKVYNKDGVEIYEITLE